MSEIYPVEELQWENNSVGNLIRPYAIKLQSLSHAESAALLSTLLDLDLADELPVTTLIGLCADPNSTWVDLRVGELKTLAAIACQSTDDILDGCAWIAQFNELPTERAKVYRCLSDLVQISVELAHPDPALFKDNLSLMYSAETVSQAEKLLNQTEQYFGLINLGENMQGSRMHQQLLAAYGKVWKR
jgi:ribosomal protein S12 methylthiotransferase accessory factor